MHEKSLVFGKNPALRFNEYTLAIRNTHIKVVISSRTHTVDLSTATFAARETTPQFQMLDSIAMG